MTIIIILVTFAVSVVAFKHGELFDKLKFNAYRIVHYREWNRLLSHGFIHADWMHLIINMLVFLSFGRSVEDIFEQLQMAEWLNNPVLDFALLYFGGIVISSLWTLIKHHDNEFYNSVGASGAVSAVVFTSIFFNPWGKIYFYGLIGIPGIVLGFIYLAYSYYMSKKGGDNINHDAHFVGAVYGFVFPLLIDYKMFDLFLNNLQH